MSFKTNTSITAALCFLRDSLKQQALEILTPAEEELKIAKAHVHSARIKFNQLTKRADEVQKLITIEMQQDLIEEKQVEQDYSFKSHSELKDLLNDS